MTERPGEFRGRPSSRGQVSRAQRGRAQGGRNQGGHSQSGRSPERRARGSRRPATGTFARTLQKLWSTMRTYKPNLRAIRPNLMAQWPILSVALIFVVSFVLVAAGFWRRGALLIGIAVGIAAVLRLVLATDRAGLLAVRSKSLDFATMTTASAVVVYIAATIDPLGTS